MVFGKNHKNQKNYENIRTWTIPMTKGTTTSGYSENLLLTVSMAEDDAQIQEATFSLSKALAVESVAIPSTVSTLAGENKLVTRSVQASTIWWY